MDSTPRHNDRLLTETEVAGLLVLKIRTLQTWRRKKGGPAFVKIGGAVRYRRSAIEAWLDSCTVRSAAKEARA